MYFQIPDTVPSIFEAIVQNMNDELLAAFQAIEPGITGIHFQHGHPLEIVETLAQYDVSTTKKYEKYPLVFLVEDIKERHGVNGANGRYAELDLKLFLIHHTKNDYKAADRYEKIFIPFLLPMYASLINNMARDPHFLVTDVYAIEHTKINRLYWGREAIGGNDQNALNDYVDAIELDSLKITQDIAYCTNPISNNI